MIEGVLRRLKTLGRSSLRFRRTVVCPTELLGTPYGSYAICPTFVDERSVVYCFGVGLDTSFDEELIARRGVTVHAFDPTPRSIEWLKSRATSDHFVFHAWGIADFDGTAKFYPPTNPTHTSHTIVPSGSRAGAGIDVRVLRLQTTMQRLGHERVDVLKMDVEGAEYSVLKDVLASGVPVGQILIEFHHHRPGIAIATTQEAIDGLERAGYEMFHGDPRGYEFSFLRSDLAEVTREKIAPR